MDRTTVPGTPASTPQVQAGQATRSVGTSVLGWNLESVITMKEPTSKSELLQAMVTARNEWDALIAQIPRHRLSESAASGSWSVKDVVAHVTEYDRWLALGLAMRLQKPPQIWLDDISLDEFNAFSTNRSPTEIPTISSRTRTEFSRT